jgi:benzoyl-CoA 2,3-epoxidase subunit B
MRGERLIDAEAWGRRQRDWPPTDEDRTIVKSLMQQVTEPGKMAAWLAPPEGGINNLPAAYEYVRLN